MVNFYERTVRMIKFSFLKLVREAILPALLLIFAKVIGVSLANYLYNLDWFISGGIVFNGVPLIAYRDSESLILANSFSAFIALICLALGLGWVILRAHHFHSSHVHPKVATKLHQNGLEFLIQDSYQIYHEGAVWLSLLWFSFFLLAFQYYLGVANLLALCVYGLAAVFLTTIFYLDIEKELKIEG